MPATTRDHVPPICLFDNKHRPENPIIPACKQCNGGSSTADLVTAIMCRWAYAPERQESKDHRNLVRRLKKQAPEIVKEWTALSLTERKAARIHLEQHGVYAPNNSVISIGEKTIPHLYLFAHKMTLGLYFHHCQKPITSAGGCWATWETKEDIQIHPLPKELPTMFDSHAFLQQGSWNTKEEFEYLYSSSGDKIFRFCARLRKTMIIIGAAVSDISILKDTNAEDWLAPSDLLNILHQEKFTTRSI